VKKYVKLTTSLKERLLFLFTGIISSDAVKIVKPWKRIRGKSYTHYPLILPDPQEPQPSISRVPDKPTPAPKKPRKKAAPKPAPVRVAREKVVKEEKMPEVPLTPFFDFVDGKTKSNI